MDLYDFQRELKKSERNIWRRLNSILLDSNFVLDVTKQFSATFPIIANLRCGAWYRPSFDSTCYFKSTDGHYGQWLFNLSRINLHVAFACSKNGGCIIIDSTRKGKPFPDSFNRTIPIWISVVNNSVYKFKKEKFIENGESLIHCEDELLWTDLDMPPWISSSEKQQIREKIPKFVEDLLGNQILSSKIAELAQILEKPLRGLYFNPNSIFGEHHFLDMATLPYFPVICISASILQKEGETYYIQGAADDHESWSMGLEAEMFWENKDFIMSSECGVEERIRQVVQNWKKKVDHLEEQRPEEWNEKEFNRNFCFLGETGLAVGTKGSDQLWKTFDAVVSCSPEQESSLSKKDIYLHMTVKEGKSDKNKISKLLPTILPFVWNHLKQNHKILIISSPGIDVALSVTLAVLINFFDIKGNWLGMYTVSFSKNFVRSMLYFMMQFCPEWRVPRIMLNDLNRFFMAPKEVMPVEAQKYWQEVMREIKKIENNKGNEENEAHK